MRGNVPASVAIGAQALRMDVKGDTIEERFKSLLDPVVLLQGCFMCGTDDEMFRSVVGAVMLSYGPDAPEFKRIEAEMLALQRISTFMAACQQGLNVSLPEDDEKHEPIGLVRLWAQRPQR